MHGNGAESMFAYFSQRERLWGMLITANEDSIMKMRK